MMAKITGVIILLCVTSLLGNTLYVTSFSDSGPGSLRDIIDVASHGDSIKFSRDFHISLVSQLVIDKTLTILGEQREIILDGKEAVRILVVEKGSVVQLSDIILAHGNGKGNTADFDGGGIKNLGVLTLYNCQIYACNTINNGGGIYNTGELSVHHSLIAQNIAHQDGGGICSWGEASKLTITDSQIEYNVGSGICVEREFNCERTKISHNSKSGIIVNNHLSFNPTLSQCEICDNGGRGILINLAFRIYIEGCRINGNGTGGIVISEGRLEINGSEINNNTLYGIELKEYCRLTMNNCVVSDQYRGIFGWDENHLIIDQSNFIGNRAEAIGLFRYSGGAIFCPDGQKLLVTRCLFKENYASESGGAIWGYFEETMISETQFIANSCDRDAGALHLGVSAPCQIVGCHFEDNFAKANGGAINVGSSYTSVDIANTLFSRNQAERGGAIYNQCEQVAVSKSRFLANNSLTSGGALYNTRSGEIVLYACEFENSQAELKGGAIYNGYEPVYPTIGTKGIIKITGGKFLKNASLLDGGALCNADSAFIEYVDFTENFAQSAGGGICHDGGGARMFCKHSSFTMNKAANGGAIFSMNRMEINSSTFNANLATFGGGIYIDGRFPVTLINSTFYENKASDEGGGVWNCNENSSIFSCTFSRNINALGAGLFASSTLTLCNTLIAYSQLGADYKGIAPLGNFTNLVADGSLPGALAVDPLLGELNDNGGPTLTCAPDDTSLAIDSGTNSAVPAGCDWDQRNRLRIFGGIVDIGSVEYQGTTSIGPEMSNIPILFSLQQNFPNPFNSLTSFIYDLPHSMWIRIEIYDVGGRLVETLFNGMQEAGNHRLCWDGSRFSSGIYLMRFTTPIAKKQIRIMLVK
ncbi:MAG TPA: right-handed parallel beta-helix repeat-containing protein [bacterium]|nr:right-handed parallel beta-helix repeat-containing protein [bacterium]